MALNQQEKKIVQFGKEKGKSKEEIMKAVSKFREQSQQPEQKQTFLQEAGEDISQIGTGIRESFQRRRGNIQETRQATREGRQTGQEGILQTIGQSAGLAGDVIGETAMGLGKALLPQSAEDTIAQQFQNLMEKEGVQRTVQEINRLSEENPRLARNVAGVLGIGELGLDLFGGGLATRGARTAVREAGESAVGRAVKRGTQRAGQAVSDVTQPVVSGAERVAQTAGRVGRRVGRKRQRSRELGQMTPQKRELVRTGIPERDVAILENATPQEKQLMREATESAQKGVVEGKKIPEGKEPEAIAGSTIMDRFKHLEEADKRIGKEFGDKLDKLPNQKIDVSNVRNTFDEVLNRFGVQRTDDGLDFGDSVISGQGSGSIRNMLEDINKRIVDDMTPDQIQKLRQKLFRELDLAKKKFEANATDEAMIKQIRSELGQRLDEFASQQGIEDLADLRTQIARIKDAKSDIAGLVGNNFDRFTPDELLNLRAGEVGGRILNRQSAQYKRILNDLENIARETGFDKNVDMTRMLEFTDMLERNIGTTRTRSFRAETGGAGGPGQQATRALKGATRLDIGEVAEGTRGVLRSLEQAPEEKIRALKQFLE